MSDTHEERARMYERRAAQTTSANARRDYLMYAREERNAAAFNRRFPAYLLGALIFIAAMLVVLWLA